jgi:hypothetical protein
MRAAVAQNPPTAVEVENPREDIVTAGDQTMQTMQTMQTRTSPTSAGTVPHFSVASSFRLGRPGRRRGLSGRRRHRARTDTVAPIWRPRISCAAGSRMTRLISSSPFQVSRRWRVGLDGRPLDRDAEPGTRQGRQLGPGSRARCDSLQAPADLTVSRIVDTPLANSRVRE